MNAIEYARTQQNQFVSELCDLVRIPSISTQPEHKKDIARAASWLREQMRAAGFNRVEIMPTSGHPVVYGECLTAGPEAYTVLIYGHYDVQPPDPLEAWRTPPFEPTVIGDTLFGRGAADDKGQLYTHIKAVEALMQTNGRLPVNIKCIFEGEEETGSPNLTPFIEEHQELLAADIVLISDTHILGPEQPTIVYALRGLAYLEVQVTGPGDDLHSGTYGGAVHNPINALCAMIARLHDKHGRIAVPGFYDQVRELDAQERTELAKLPFDYATWLAQADVRQDWGEQEYTITERTTARPTLDVNGMWGGYIQPGAKTVLPSKASAKISMRLVPDQDPERIGHLVGNYLREIAPPTVDVKISKVHGGDGALMERDSPAMRAAFEAYKTGFGHAPIFAREGGSIPVVASFKRIMGLETILMGFGLPDDRLHAPNEKFYLPNFHRGVETSIHFLQGLNTQIP